MSLTTTLFAALRAVGTTCTLAMGGVILRRQGLMTAQVSQALSKISSNLTLPCLLFASALNCDEDEKCPSMISILKDGWPMLILPFLVVGAGCLVGFVFAKISNAPSNFFMTAVAATAFANSTGLPITLLTAISTQSSTPGTDDGDDDNRDDDNKISQVSPLVYLSIYLVTYPILQWSVGAALLSPSSPVLSENEKQNSPEISQDDQAEHDIIHVQVEEEEEVSETRLSTSNYISRMTTFILEPDLPIAHIRQADENDLVQTDHPLTIAKSQRYLSTRKSIEQDVNNSEEENDDTHIHGHGGGRAAASVASKWITAIMRILPPPAMAAVLGMIIALITPVRAIFVDLRAKDYDAPMQWLFKGIKRIGDAAVPINSFILGNSLCKRFEALLDDSIAQDSIPPKVLFAVLFAKMVIMPALGAILALGLRAANILKDSAALLVTMIVTATPTANNLMVMAELAGQNKEGLASSIFTQYKFFCSYISYFVAYFFSSYC